jgi:hypothetical protein
VVPPFVAVNVDADASACTPPQVGDQNHSGLTCVTVNVYRDPAHGNPLPTYFAHVFGLTSQSVRASAIARPIPANSSKCVWPLAIPDRWRRPIPGPAWTPGPPPSVFDPAVDTYIAPSAQVRGTGFKIANGTLRQPANS